MALWFSEIGINACEQEVRHDKIWENRNVKLLGKDDL